MNPCSSLTNRTAYQTGFSLVELMIAIAIGLMITAGLTTIFVGNSRAQTEIERANRQMENGRYAMQLLTDDLRLAGYYGELDPTKLPAPPNLPADPCLRLLPDDLKKDMLLHVQGYDDEEGSPSLNCLSDVRSGTDILVIRRVSTCVAGSADCEGIRAAIPYFQASSCNDADELGSTIRDNYYALDTDATKLTRHKRDCAAPADIRRYRTHIYFIANNGRDSDGIPTLKRAELDSDGTATKFLIVPLVDGIENMQLEYGLDTDDNGAPDAYATQPGNGVANWQNVVAVRLSLLARNTTASPGYTHDKDYTLGLKADGTANIVSPPNDGFKRHAYQTFVKLINPAGRREQ